MQRSDFDFDVISGPARPQPPALAPLAPAPAAPPPAPPLDPAAAVRESPRR